jgi:thimet oligopeptidase
MLSADLDPQRFADDARLALEEAKRALARTLALPEDAPFARVLAAFDAIGRPLDRVRGPAGLASQVHPNEALRDVANTVIQELASFGTELSLHRGVWERLARLDPRDVPGVLERRLHEHALRDFRRSGVDRDEATRQRVRELSDALVRIGQEFDLNIAADTRSIRIPEGRRGLAGLPADYVEAHAENERGEVVITTDPPDYVPFMTYAERGDLRRALWREYQNRAVPKNLEVLPRLIEKRHELATLLGYRSWADYVTEDKMVKSAASAKAFIERVAAASRARLTAETSDLLALKRESEPGARDVREWERAWLVERLRSRRFGFDSASVRPYFAYRNVRDGVLATSAALYGIEFRRNPELAVWHASVEGYDVLDQEKLVARLYLDMHPRPNKYKHAAMFDLQLGADGGVPEAALVCNFPEPTASDPALLLHRDVETFFHEFGHLLHHLFAGRQRYLAFAGIATEWDFVEAPSQMYEEWAWDVGVLQRFARHHQTGEPIPEDLVRRMREADECGKGLHVAGQMFYADLALDYYDRDPAGLDTTRRMVELKARHMPFPHEEGTHFQASFGHLNGYSAIYYTYMWSLVIAKDLFSRFDGHLMDGAVAREYRQAILAAGGTKDASELTRNFLGRDYSTEPFERWLNR